MTRSISFRNRIVEENAYDDSGTLIAQKIFEVVIQHGTENIHRSVKQIIRFRDKDKSYKEIVCAQACAVVPNNDESEKMMKHLLGRGEKQQLNNESVSSEIPAMV